MRHAPPGGISVGGDRYEGGQFLPEDDFTRSRRIRKSLDDVYGAIRCGRKVVVALFDRDQEAVVERVSESGVLCRYVERFGGERHVWAQPRDISPLPSSDTGAKR